MSKTLRHQEPDRVAISDSFWGSLIQRWQQELYSPPDALPYYHYDLDCPCEAPVNSAGGHSGLLRMVPVRPRDRIRAAVGK